MDPVPCSRGKKSKCVCTLSPEDIRGKFKQCSICREISRRASARVWARKRTFADINDGNNPPSSTSSLASWLLQAPLASPALSPEAQSNSNSGSDSDSDSNEEDISKDDKHQDKHRKVILPTHYTNMNAMFKALAAMCTGNEEKVEFGGYFTMPADNPENDCAQIHAINADLLATIKIRFTVRKHDKKRKSGLRTFFHCSQDARRTQKPQKVADQSKQRKNVGMDRFPCESHLQIAVSHRPNGTQDVSIRFQHMLRHVDYINVSMPPTAFQLISDHLSIAKPADLLPSVQALDGCGHVSSAQVYRAWTTLSEVLWCRDDDALKSALMLLEEYRQDGRAVQLELTLPEGVNAIAWALPSILDCVKGVVKEVALDATYCTNAADLELYGLLGEVEAFGVPLAYVLLDTVQSIEPKKRRQALGSWLASVRDQYGINPSVMHTDKDFGEIGAAKDVWPDAKHQLCYWHLRKAVRKQMALSRLSTAPYHPFEANAEFGFIDLAFLPQCRPNKSDPDAEDRLVGTMAHVPGPTRPPGNIPTIHIPASQRPADSSQHPSELTQSPNDRPTIRIGNIRLQLLPSNAVIDEDMTSVHVEDEGIERQTIFCPKNVRPMVARLMERHFCAHPELLGQCAPTPMNIRFWAVKEIYDLCNKHDLPELWVYLWEGWY